MGYENLLENLMFVRYSRLEDPNELFEDPELIGEELYDFEDKIIGKVRDILVDTKSKKMKFLEISLDSEIEPDKEERHVLVPIGLASFDDNDRLTLDHLERKHVLLSPRYMGDVIDVDYMKRLIDSFAKSSDMGMETGYRDEDFEKLLKERYFDSDRVKRRHRTRSRSLDWETVPETRKKF